MRQSIGVCAGIMPFNSPLAGIAWKTFPALLCGNAIVVKSHELTPFTAVHVGKLLRDAGLPVGLYSAVQGYGPEVGAPLVQDPRVGVVSFTGSAPTGKLIQKMVSERDVLAKVCLELGGKNPLVVCDDADLGRQWSTRRRRRSSTPASAARPGAACSCSPTVYDEFRERFLERVKSVKVGSGPEDECGPVITRGNLDRLVAAVGCCSWPRCARAGWWRAG